jgi:hypothetical protein
LGVYGFAFSPKFITMTKKGGEGKNRERGEGREGEERETSHILYIESTTF